MTVIATIMNPSVAYTFAFLYLLLAISLPSYVGCDSPPLKVLVIVPPAFGHVYAPFALVEELIQRGHQATLLLLDCPHSNNITFPPSNVKKLAFPCEALRDFEEKSFISKVSALYSTFNSLELLKLIKEEISIYQPDVVVVDFILEAIDALSRTLSIPTVSFHYVVQEYFIESYIPSILLGRSPPLDFSGRIMNLLASLQFRLAMPIIQFFTLPDVTEVGVNWPSTPSMILVAGEFGMFPARSVPPFVKVVGPMITTKRQPHDKDLEILLEEMGKTSKAVVYVSFGTAITLPSDTLKNVLEALGNVSDVKFLWAVTHKDMAASLSSLVVPPNVVIKRHLPQLQVLVHPAVKLFISHCGANSASEAQHVGIPVLAIPLGADQFFIASTLVSLGMAEKLDSTNIQVESFTSTVNKLLNDSTYRMKALHFSNLINTAGGAHEAVSHIERLVAMGTIDPFIPESFKVSWWIRWHLDIYITVFLGILLLKKSFPYLLRFCCFCCFSCRNGKIKLD